MRGRRIISPWALEGHAGRRVRTTDYHVLHAHLILACSALGSGIPATESFVISLAVICKITSRRDGPKGI